MFAMVDVVRSALEAIAWSDLAAFLFRLTAIAGLGSVALALLPRASAAVRHRIALATLATCLALPLATLLPAQHVPVLPALPAQPAVTSVTQPASAPRPLASAPTTPVVRIMPRTLSEPLAVEVRDRTAASASPTLLEPIAPTTVVEPFARRSSSTRGWQTTLTRVWSETVAPRLTEMVLSAWSGGFERLPLRTMLGAMLAMMAIVTLLGLARMLFAMLAAWRLVRESVPVADTRLRHAFGLAQAALGITRPVELRQSSRLAVPVVTGIVSPTLLVPVSAATWSRERLTSVLMHELAHVARHDPLSQLVARLATSLFWFHPLIHVLDRHAWLSCEQACDDVVLAHGARPSAYAEDLLAIARDARPRDPWRGLAPAFVRRSGLERRLASILAPGLRRGAGSRWTRVGIAAAALISLAMLGPVRLVPARAGQPQATAAAVVTTPTVAISVAKAPPDAERVVADRGEAEPEAGVHADDVSNEATSDAESAEEAAPSETTAPLAPAVLSEAHSDEPDFELAAGGSGNDWFNRGRERYEDEDYAAAASAYMRAAAAGYRTETAFYNAACSWALDGQTEPALTALQAALDAGFDNPDLLADDDDLNILRNEPRFTQILRRARGTDKAEAKRRSAVTEYEGLKTARSKDADEWRSTGIALMRSGETSRAVNAFETQYAIDSSASCIYNTACALALGGRRAAALETLERSIMAGSGDADHMLQDADLVSLRHDEEFDRLVEMSRDLELVFPPGLGGKGSWRSSLSRFERVTRQYPDVGRAWFNLGYARLASGDAEGSVQANRRALSLGYRVPTTMYNLACGSAQMGETDDAIRWLQRAESAGIGLGQLLSNDDDLDPIRSDPRFQRMRDRWRRQQWELKQTEHKKKWDQGDDEEDEKDKDDVDEDDG